MLFCIPDQPEVLVDGLYGKCYPFTRYHGNTNTEEKVMTHSFKIDFIHGPTLADIVAIKYCQSCGLSYRYDKELERWIHVEHDTDIPVVCEPVPVPIKKEL